MENCILAIDQGTTSSRALIFDSEGNKLSVGQQEFAQQFPNNGWVEHDAMEIWQSTIASCHSAIKSASISANQIRCIGITNQRETSLFWNRHTGEPIHRALVWQDRRTASACEDLKEAGHEPLFKQRTGLVLDPYFSGTKASWLLNNVDGARSVDRSDASRPISACRALPNVPGSVEKSRIVDFNG